MASLSDLALVGVLGYGAYNWSKHGSVFPPSSDSPSGGVNISVDAPTDGDTLLPDGTFVPSGWQDVTPLEATYYLPAGKTVAVQSEYPVTPKAGDRLFFRLPKSLILQHQGLQARLLGELADIGKVQVYSVGVRNNGLTFVRQGYGENLQWEGGR